MEVTNRKEIMEKQLKDIRNHYDLNKLAEIMSVLFANNDFLKGPRNSDFDWAISTIFRLIRGTTPNEAAADYIPLYNSIVNKSAAFIKHNISDDDIKRFAFMHVLIAKECFSDGIDRQVNSYMDIRNCLGLDVILGNSCCRHRAALLKDILDNFVNTIVIPIGDSDNEIANHIMVSFKQKNRWLFLDSCSPFAYYPLDNTTVLNPLDQTKHIKTLIAFMQNDYFQKMDQYYIFFNKLFKNSRISNFKYVLLNIDLIDYYSEFLQQKDLLEAFKEEIDYEKKQIKLILK